VTATKTISGQDKTQLSLHVARPEVTEHLQTNDRPNIQTYALCTFTFSLQTCTIFFRINAFINVYYNFLDVYHIYDAYYCSISAMAYLRKSYTCDTCLMIMHQGVHNV